MAPKMLGRRINLVLMIPWRRRLGDKRDMLRSVRRLAAVTGLVRWGVGGRGGAPGDWRLRRMAIERWQIARASRTGGEDEQEREEARRKVKRLILLFHGFMEWRGGWKVTGIQEELIEGWEGRRGAAQLLGKALPCQLLPTQY